MTDIIEEIRARHEATKQALDNERFYNGYVKCMSDYNGNEAHADRATLLRALDAMVEENARMKEALQAIVDNAAIDTDAPLFRAQAAAHARAALKEPGQ